MSLNIGELVGYIKLDHTGVGKGITAAQRDMRTGMDRIQRDAGQQGEKAGKAAGDGLTGGFKGSIANIAKIAVGAFAVERVVAGLRYAKDAASDLNKTTSMSSVIFGRNAAAMKDFAQTGPRALGLSTEATLRYSASLGDMLLQLGFAEDATMDLSKATLQQAADLGSFKNLDTADVLERINASLRGEYDSLQLLIPNINAARVQTEALAATGKAAAGDLTAQEKATATLAIIQKDGARASGDFARTQEGAANATKIANAEAQDLAAKFGQQLLPAYIAMVTFGKDEVLPFLSDAIDFLGATADAADPLTDAIGGLVGTFRNLPEPLQAATLGLIAFVALRGRVEAMGASLGTKITGGAKSATSSLDGLRLGLMYASESSTTAAGRFGAVTKSLGASAATGLRGAASGVLGLLGGPWGLAFAGAIAVVGTYIKRQQEAKARVQALTDTLDNQTGALTKNTQELVRNKLETEGVLKTAQKLGLNLQDVYDAALGNADALARVRKEIEQLIPAGEEYAGTVNRGATANAALKGDIAAVLGAIGGQSSELDAAREAQERKTAITIDGGKAEGDYAAEVDETTGKVKTQAEVLRDAADAMREQIDAKLAAFDAEIGYQQSLADTAAAIAENGKTATKNRKELDLTTEAGRSNASALKDQAERTLSLAESNLEGGDSLKSLRGDMDAARTAFVENAVKMGLSKDAANAMADEFGLTKESVDSLAQGVEDLPASKTIRIEAETAAAAARLAALKTALAGLKNKTVVVTTYGRFINNSVPGAGRSIVGGQTIDSADGNILRFANGAEDHRAFIAGGGTPMRIFNEPETGGEGYIPLSPAKRPRSTAILGQIADEFGYHLAPKGRQAVTAGASTRTATTHHHWNIANLAVPNYDGFREATAEEQRVKNISGGV